MIVVSRQNKSQYAKITSSVDTSCFVINTQQMYDSDLFKEAKLALENCRGLRQLLGALPNNTEISLNLDKRVYASLILTDGDLKLDPRHSLQSDFEIILFPQSIRQLRDSSPDSIVALVKTFSELVALGYAKIHLNTSLKELYSKGYLESFKNLGPEIQSELSKYAYLLIGHISQAVESIKAVLKR